MSKKNQALSSLFETLYQIYHYDFREYQAESALRRVHHRMAQENLTSITELQEAITNNKEIANRLLKDLSINYTLMFRDPLFFKTFRTIVVDKIKQQNHIKIWHAGCSTGEEVYSMAILLKEEGLLNKCHLYATDFNRHVLETAKAGIFPLKGMADNISNYHQSGGTTDFADFYRVKFDHVSIDTTLKNSISFSYHNLTEDTVFCEVDVIICRNVFIYFSNTLKTKVFNLFHQALAPKGIFCCGQNDMISHCKTLQHYKTLSVENRIFQKNDTLY